MRLSAGDLLTKETGPEEPGRSKQRESCLQKKLARKGQVKVKQRESCLQKKLARKGQVQVSSGRAAYKRSGPGRARSK
jgi:hypothetical protein